MFNGMQTTVLSKTLVGFLVIKKLFIQELDHTSQTNQFHYDLFRRKEDKTSIYQSMVIN